MGTPCSLMVPNSNQHPSPHWGFYPCWLYPFFRFYPFFRLFCHDLLRAKIHVPIEMNEAGELFAVKKKEVGNIPCGAVERSSRDFPGKR